MKKTIKTTLAIIVAAALLIGGIYAVYTLVNFINEDTKMPTTEATTTEPHTTTAPVVNKPTTTEPTDETTTEPTSDGYNNIATGDDLGDLNITEGGIPDDEVTTEAPTTKPDNFGENAGTTEAPIETSTKEPETTTEKETIPAPELETTPAPENETTLTPELVPEPETTTTPEESTPSLEDILAELEKEGVFSSTVDWSEVESVDWENHSQPADSPTLNFFD